ncbi:hypothetical protein AALO_G00054270 [Alosa alosa]|uniref:PDZ domain-containing protein n=1 Tax=Alosa alosa TaxID=278164 RepID=A0AAV6H8F1_9TELE|nr:hypothetical protein AALO_G00054270 [Alosa alosa]
MCVDLSCPSLPRICVLDSAGHTHHNTHTHTHTHKSMLERLQSAFKTVKDSKPTSLLPHRFVTVRRGSPAARSGQIRPGDRLEAVEGRPVVTLPHRELAQILRRAGNTLRLTIVPRSSAHASDNADFDTNHRTRKGHRSRPKQDSRYYSVDLERGPTGFGFSLRGGSEYNMGLYVLGLMEGGPAQRSHKIQVSDQLVEINGDSTTGMTHSQAVERIRTAGHHIHLVLKRGNGYYVRLGTNPTMSGGIGRVSLSFPPSLHPPQSHLVAVDRRGRRIWAGERGRPQGQKVRSPSSSGRRSRSERRRKGGGGGEEGRRRRRKMSYPDSAEVTQDEEEEGEEAGRPSSHRRGQRSRSLSAGAERRKGRSLPRNTRKNHSDDEVTVRSQSERGRERGKEKGKEQRRGGLRKSGSMKRLRWLESQSEGEEDRREEEGEEEDDEDDVFMPIPNQRLPRSKQGRRQQVEEWESEEEEEEEEEVREEDWVEQQGRRRDVEEEEGEPQWGSEGDGGTGWEREREGEGEVEVEQQEERVRAWASQVQRERMHELELEVGGEGAPRSPGVKEREEEEEEQEEEEGESRPRRTLPHALSGLPVLPVGAKLQLYVPVLPPLAHEGIPAARLQRRTSSRLHPFSFLGSPGSEDVESESGASVSVASTTAASISGLSLVLSDNHDHRKYKTPLPGPWLTPSPHTLHRVIQGNRPAWTQEGRGGRGGGVPRFIH